MYGIIHILVKFSSLSKMKIPQLRMRSPTYNLKYLKKSYSPSSPTVPKT